ncbi:MAG TPA: 2'-5' RNA ligase family protein [Propionibacteriaceae bacterium]|nr:2'-5' RNA ligase family protein [Propionibacteriaceae bacterium]
MDSVLAVPVPEADPVVRDIRARLDSSAALGVPAHVTVLYPFLPPQAIDDTVLRRLAELFAQTDSFSYEFVETRWFGEDVLWLAPADDTGFRGLTHVVQDSYPDYPPYKAAFAEVTPHLTIGHGHELAMLEIAARQVSDRLPIRGQARAVHLLVEQADGLYQQRAIFSLRRAASSDHPEL